MPVGYSGTPLIKKLGVTTDSQIVAINQPSEYAELLGELPNGARIEATLTKSTTLVHLFATERQALQKQLETLRRSLEDSVPVWVSWPKKVSKVPTDITEDTIRTLALPLGYVDIKVCAVSDVWSGLKLVVRKNLRVPNSAKLER